MAIPELGAQAARERAGSNGSEIIAAETAYLVYIRKDTGQVVITPNVNTAITVERAPSHDEIFMTSQVIIKDVVGQQYAAMSAQATLQLNNAVAQQAATLGGLGDLRV